MSKAKIKPKVKLELAITSGGCCERCGKYLSEDFLTKTKVQFAEHAHIIPDSRNVSAPRSCDYIEDYDRESTENLMLLCSSCHTIIDNAPEKFPTELLKKIKKDHEDRIKYLISLTIDKELNVIIFHSRIKNNDTVFNLELIKKSILDDGYYPKNNGVFDLSCDSAINDDDPLYYQSQVKSLITKFNATKDIMLKKKSILFSLAPQPLLIRLGMLLSNGYDIIVKQKTRSPEGWFFVDDVDDLKFEVTKPKSINLNNEVCIVFAISDYVDISRVIDAVNSNTDIWTITINNPNMNCILKQKHIDDFAIICINLLNEIKNIYGLKKEVHIFPVMPNSLAITFGRCYMPKVHCNLIIYDQIKNEFENEFKKAFSYIDGQDVF